MEDRQYEVREYEGSRFEMSNKLKGILIILGGILLVVGVIIFAVSWETLEPLEYGLVSTQQPPQIIFKFIFIYAWISNSVNVIVYIIGMMCKLFKLFWLN